MSTHIKSVEVDCPIRTVYDQWTQFESFPQFMEGVESITQLNDRDLHWVVDIAGVKREFDATVTDQTPDRRVAWTTVDGPYHDGAVTFEALSPERTKVSVQMDFEPQGAVEKIGDAVGIVSGRIQGDLNRFKTFIEERGVETGAWRGEIGGTST